MRFKLWLETNVSKWQSQINQINRKFAFTNWFPPDGKVIPFKFKQAVDEDILKHFENKIVDYKLKEMI